MHLSLPILLAACAEPPPPAPDEVAPAPEEVAPAPEEVVIDSPPEPTFSREPIPAELRERMTGVSWKEGCPVGLDALALLHVPHWGFDGEVHEGLLIVHADVADGVLEAFRAVYAARFPIERMRPVHEYGGSDDASMAANNTSAFNCRPIVGSDQWSNHSYGRAIDLNPVQNPYVRGGMVLPPAGKAFLDRDQPVKGLVTAGSPVVAAFDAAGWQWGGRWNRLKDYQHFEKAP